MKALTEEQIIMKFLENKSLTWEDILTNFQIPIMVAEKYCSQFNDICWHKYLINNHYSCEFIQRHINQFNDYSWHIILTNKKFSLSFIKKNKFIFLQNNVILKDLIRYQELSEEFIEKNLLHRNSIIIYFIIVYQTLSEDFIQKYKSLFLNKKNIIYILSNQKLSLNFIKTYSYKYSFLLWETIYIHQKIDENYISNNFDILLNHMNTILMYQKLSDRFITNHIYKFTKRQINLIIEHQTTLKQDTLDLLNSFYIKEELKCYYMKN